MLSTRPMLVALGVGALLIACGATEGPAANPTPAPTPSAQPTVPSTAAPMPTQPAPTATPAPSATTVVSVYLLRDGKVMPVHRIVSVTTPARDSLLALIAGPTGAEVQQGFYSNVPATTRLLGVSIVGGVATADFAPSFGLGGSIAGSSRVAEMVYTLTQFRTVRSVNLRYDGVPVAGMSGLTRAAAESWTPAIFIEAPVVGQAVTSPLRIWGTSNTFEGVFRVRLTTAAGVQLFDYNVQATSGTGTLGTFDVTVRFTATGPATLAAYELSMKDGWPVNAVSIPLTLQP